MLAPDCGLNERHGTFPRRTSNGGQGSPRCRISCLENGRAIPTLETLEKMAEALEIPLHQLLYDGDQSVLQQSVAMSKVAGVNGNRQICRKEERTLFELRQYVNRIPENDQHLLVYIARQMASRASLGRLIPGARSGRRPHRTASGQTIGKDS
jgi:transcriptional regulator with XRE-family HTH domain